MIPIQTNSRPARSRWFWVAVGLVTSGSLGLVGCGGEPVDCVSALPMKRLTNYQFNQSISDLFSPVEFEAVGFPEQPIIGGFNNNATANLATPALADAIYAGSINIAAQVVSNIDLLNSCLSAECNLQWLLDIGERAWRRPLSLDETTEIEVMFWQWHDQFDEDEAIQLSVQYLILSPEFLYMPEVGVRNSEGQRELTSFESATRLSYFLTNSLPDKHLMDVAATEQPMSATTRETQAWRLLEGQRARDSFREFSRQWLELDEIGTGSVDFDLFFPGVDEETVDDHLYDELQPAMRYEPEVLIDQLIFEQGGNLAELFTTTESWITSDASWLHDTTIDDNTATGIDWVGTTIIQGREIEFEETFFPIDLDPSRRMGILTLPGLMHARSHPAFPSPTLRGLFVLERILCQEVQPPSEDFLSTLLEPSEDTGAPETNRQRYEEHLYNTACVSCHEGMDGIGLTFENYDSLGLFQSTDNGVNIDSSGEITGTDVDGHVANAIELSTRLSTSRDVHNCLVTNMMSYAYGAVESDEIYYGLNDMQELFWASNGDIINLMVEIVSSDTFEFAGEVEQ